MGAALVAPRIDDAVRGGHHSTFGGNPLACAAGLATLDVILGKMLWERAARLGAEGLEALQAIEGVSEVRGRGLMIGLEPRGKAAPIVRELQAKGFLASMAGSRVVRLLPPMTIEEDLWASGLEALGRVLRDG